MIKLTKIILFLITTILLGSTTFADRDRVLRIEIGKDYKNYSNSDLRRRVWQLEQAVDQLQRRVFELELKDEFEKPKPEVIKKEEDKWFCKITAMGKDYAATGPTKPKAKMNAIEACKKESSGDGFFCKDPVCEE